MSFLSQHLREVNDIQIISENYDDGSNKYVYKRKWKNNHKEKLEPIYGYISYFGINVIIIARHSHQISGMIIVPFYCVAACIYNIYNKNLPLLKSYLIFLMYGYLFVTFNLMLFRFENDET